MKFTMTAPCPKCPFRTDIDPFLSLGRAVEICDAITRGQQTFQCHKTVDYNKADDDGEVESHVAASEKNAQHCAGAMIMLERMEQPNQMMRICERLGMYDRRKLEMDAPVFKSAREMIAAHRKSNARSGNGDKGSGAGKRVLRSGSGDGAPVRAARAGQARADRGPAVGGTRRVPRSRARKSA
jgi:hypothetical protein